jgi:aspartyl-tRNA(Asn)/glutamyl-tRNA(Gln) amidotransferase subunit C
VTLSPDQIHKLATLAKLKIDDSSMEEISRQLDNIMGLIDQLEQADTAGIEPLSHPQDPVLRLREDQVIDGDRRDDFMALTTHNQEGLYLVPKVIE